MKVTQIDKATVLRDRKQRSFVVFSPVHGVHHSIVVPNDVKPCVLAEFKDPSEVDVDMPYYENVDDADLREALLVQAIAATDILVKS
tara:strand:- start:26689 stop:26949 length:261 start_codon:yes stop_codon:yes gene_type:complete